MHAWIHISSRVSRGGPSRLAPALCAALLAACADGGPVHEVAGGDAVQGASLLAQYQCGSCHRIPGVPAARSLAGPALDAFGRRSYIGGQFPNTPDTLVRWIVDPPAMKPATLMPAMGVSQDDARHMAAYLYTLR